MAGYAEVGLARCIDEAILVGGDTISFGLAGSHIARRGGGDQNALPDEVRYLFEKNQSPVYSALAKIMTHIDGLLLASSHEGCAYAAKQAIDDVESVTREMCSRLDVGYAGHIVHNQTPVALSRGNVSASITRPNFIHRHSAGSILLTHGAGVKDSELRKLRLPQPFLVDISFGAKAIANGAKYDEMVRITALQLDLADGIMDGQLGKKVTLFNGGRLPRKEREINERIAIDAMDSIGGVLTRL